MFLKRKEASRQFIDLIRDTSTMYANWEPGRLIQLGDFGTVDRYTGSFEKEGNIYTDFLADAPPDAVSEDRQYIVFSSNVEAMDLSATFKLNAAAVAEASIKGCWKFVKKRGALLILARPRSVFLPSEVLEHLTQIPRLKDKSIVTQVKSCPAYTLYLSSAANAVVGVALSGSLPVPGTPAISAGGGAEAKWLNEHTGGILRDACDANGSYCYYPLFELKVMAKPRVLRRGSPVPDPQGADLWVNTPVPWELLNDDGEEEEFEDTVPDSDSD